MQPECNWRYWGRFGYHISSLKIKKFHLCGGMCERLKQAVLKTA